MLVAVLQVVEVLSRKLLNVSQHKSFISGRSGIDKMSPHIWSCDFYMFSFGQCTQRARVGWIRPLADQKKVKYFEIMYMNKCNSQNWNSQIQLHLFLISSSTVRSLNITLKWGKIPFSHCIVTVRELRTNIDRCYPLRIIPLTQQFLNQNHLIKKNNCLKLFFLRNKEADWGSKS